MTKTETVAAMDRAHSYTPRWWNVAVVGVSVLVGTLVWYFQSADFLLAAAALGLYLLAWFTIGRLAFSGEHPRVSLGYTAFLIVISAFFCTISPNFATMQTVTYPLLWLLAASTRSAIVANVIAAIGVTVGLIIGFGGGIENITEAVFIGVLSLAFSIAIGLWITSVEVRSDERLVLLEQLRATQDSLATLSRDAGVSSERERLAREIHDTIAQDLTGLVLLSQQARRQLAAGDLGGTGEHLAMLEENARLALGETRALVAATSPTALDDGGIGPALERLGERFGRETGILVDIETDVAAPLDRASEVVLLRCAQEGLANVRKHSGASTAHIGLSVAAAGATLTISDDGTGFDDSARFGGGTPGGGGFGLAGMRERLALVAGSLDISSSPAGTRLTATLPAGAAP